MLPPPLEKQGSVSMYGAPSYGSYGNYGNSLQMDAAGKVPFVHRRRHVSITVIVLCFFIPVVVYAVVCAVLSFSVHHTAAGLAWFIVILAGASTAAVGALAVTAARRRYWQGDLTREPYWYSFLAITMAGAFVFGIYLGMANWWNNMLPYMDLQNLSTYSAVNTATMTGLQLMDVGRVGFVQGTELDVSKSVGFKNVDRYCVAPIVSKGHNPESYDFWAIGLNCCSGNPNDFHCGDYDHTGARSGLRLMRADQRAFYRLAVQQAEATYRIEAKHPLFFYWMADPGAAMESYRDDSVRFYLLGLGAVFFCQLLLLVVAVVAHSKL